MIQLYSAVEHYFERNFISAITLAGAAEEILGSIALKRKGYNHFSNTTWFAQGMAQVLQVATPSISKIKAAENKLKNRLKHNNTGINERVPIKNLQYFAEEHIIGAINNYRLIHKRFPKGKLLSDFIDLIY
jgi:hypothetical protein